MQAIALDPGYATAYGWAAHCYNLAKAGGWIADPEDSVTANRLARRVWELDKDDAVAMGVAGYTLAHVAHDLDAGAHYVERALALNPNLALNWSASGWIHNWLGNPEISVEHFQRAMRLSPLDPQIGMMQNGLAHVHFQAGRYQETIAWTQAHLRSRIDHPPGLRLMAAAQAMLGRDGEARAAATRLLARVPDFRAGALAQVVGPYRNPDMVARYAEGLRRAGVPE
jgi:tetratricopeptide (TPR) repeat protein